MTRPRRKARPRCDASNCDHRCRPRGRAARSLLFASFLLLVRPPTAPCRAAPVVALTDGTFDNVREAFGNPSMLILSHASKSNDRRALDEFRKLSDDELLRDQEVMPVTVDAATNKMLAVRMGLLMDELPSLVFLQGDTMFRYQSDPTSSSAMRSYALQGYLNQGSGEPMLRASNWLLAKVTYLNWLFNGDEHAGNVNVVALLLSGFVGGLLLCGAFATIVAIRFGGEEAERNGTKKTQ